MGGLSQGMIARVVLFLRERKGVAAVEFALILPVMMLMYLGTAELTRGIYLGRKVQIVARSVSDLASRATQVVPADLTDMLNAGAAVMAPYSTAPLSIRLTGISIDTTGKTKVVWGAATGTMSAQACGSSVNVAATLKPPVGTAGFLVLAETSYAYRPTVGYLIKNTVNLSSSLFTSARAGTNIPMVPPPC